MGVLFCLSVVLVSVLLVEFLLVLLGCCSCKTRKIGLKKITKKSLRRGSVGLEEARLLEEHLI